MSLKIQMEQLLQFQSPIQMGNIAINRQANAVDANPVNLLRFLFAHWSSGIVVLRNSIREVNGDIIRELQNHDKHLEIQTSSHPTQLQLGDQVKIVLKQRQFKQVDVSKSGWNNLMKSETNKVGRVVGIQALDESEVTVFYPGNDRQWSIRAAALEKVSDIDGEDFSGQQSSYFGLKIGDDVTIDENLPSNDIRTMHAIAVLPDQAVFQYRDRLLKILAFDCRGIAVVSIDKHKSIMVHSGLLKKRNHEIPPIVTPIQKKLTRKYSNDKEYILKRNINELILTPRWHFGLTKILGKHGKICYHGPKGELGIKIDNDVYLITDAFIDVRWMKDNRRRTKSGDGRGYKLSGTFPFTVGDKLSFRIASSPQCARLLKDSGIPLAYLQILKDEICVFMGYEMIQGIQTHMAVVELRWPDTSRSTRRRFELAVPCNVLDHAPPEKAVAYQELLNDVSEIKVGDQVAIIGAQYTSPIVAKLVHSLASNDVKMALTSNAKLVAFDDDNDEAILRYDNGKLFACPSNYISLPLGQKDSSREQQVITLEMSQQDQVLFADTADLLQKCLNGQYTPSQMADGLRMCLQSYDNVIGPGKHIVQETDSSKVSTDVTAQSQSHSSDLASVERPVTTNEPDLPDITFVAHGLDRRSIEGDAVDEPTGDDELNEAASETSEVGSNVEQGLEDSRDLSEGEATENEDFEEANPRTSSDGRIRKPAELTYDPHTNDIVLKSNLGRSAAQLASPMSPFTRQNSSSLLSKGVFGGTQENYNFSNCIFNGNALIGNSGGQQAQSPSNQSNM